MLATVREWLLGPRGKTKPVVVVPVTFITRQGVERDLVMSFQIEGSGHVAEAKALASAQYMAEDLMHWFGNFHSAKGRHATPQVFFTKSAAFVGEDITFLMVGTPKISKL